MYPHSGCPEYWVHINQKRLSLLFGYTESPASPPERTHLRKIGGGYYPLNKRVEAISPNRRRIPSGAARERSSQGTDGAILVSSRTCTDYIHHQSPHKSFAELFQKRPFPRVPRSPRSPVSRQIIEKREPRRQQGFCREPPLPHRAFFRTRTRRRSSFCWQARRNGSRRHRPCPCCSSQDRIRGAPQ